MSSKLTGRLNQQYELLTGPDAVGDSDAALALHDEELIERALRHLAESEHDRGALRAILRDDPRAAETLLRDPRLTRLVAARLFDGSIIARHRIVTHHFPSDLVAGHGTLPDDERREDRYVRDWYIECHHHAAPDGKRDQSARPLFFKQGLIEVVPTVGTIVDEVKLQWRDDELGSPPRSEVFVNCAGHPEVTVRASGSSGAYSTYPIEARYRGDVDLLAFILPSFWRSFNETTSYTVSRGPGAIQVKVYNPRKFKFEFAMPPLRSYKRGVKLGGDGADPRKLASPKNLKKSVEEEREGWGPPTVPLPNFAKGAAATHLSNGPAQKREDGGAWENKNPAAEHGAAGAAIKGAAKGAKIDTLRLTRDDLVIDPGNTLATIAEILRFYRLISGIIKTIKDYAPQVGFYIDFDLQLFQGGLAAEWMWKEHTDHQAYLAWDVNLSVTVVKCTIELGVGVSGCSFKLQVFGQLVGELTVEGGYKRELPDSVGGLQITPVKGKITGAIGARAEAGNFVKLEGRGETAIELETGFGINRRGKPVTVDARARWSGIWFIGTFSAGAFGVGYTKTAKYDVCGASDWWGLSWPKEEPYKPPMMSRTAVASVFSRILTEDWFDIRVFDAQDERVPSQEVANMLADRTMADTQFDLTPDDVEALANSVKHDLIVLGERDWGRRDWVALGDLRRYMTGAVRGRSMGAHLARGHVDPLLAR